MMLSCSFDFNTAQVYTLNNTLYNNRDLIPGLAVAVQRDFRETLDLLSVYSEFQSLLFGFGLGDLTQGYP